MTWREDEFDELAAELRRRVGAEFVQEAAELEQLAELQRRRRTDLADAARAAMNRGDRVTLACSGGRWSGTLGAVAEDYLVLESNELRVEALLESVVLESQASRSGGRSGIPASATWRARLIELELNREAVTVMAPTLGIEATGIIEVVAADYLEMATEESRVVMPLASVAVVLQNRHR